MDPNVASTSDAAPDYDYWGDVRDSGDDLMQVMPASPNLKVLFESAVSERNLEPNTPRVTWPNGRVSIGPFLKETACRSVSAPVPR